MEMESTLENKEVKWVFVNDERLKRVDDELEGTGGGIRPPKH
jgi:hypothetical protein